MWRVGMWYDEGNNSSLAHLRAGGVVFGAFVVTGLIFVTLQKSMESFNQRITGKYNTQSSDDPGIAPRYADTGSVSASHPASSPYITAPLNAAPSYSSSPVVSLPPPVITPVNVPASFSTFRSNAEKVQAEYALADLKITAQSFRKYNSETLPRVFANVTPEPSGSRYVSSGDARDDARSRLISEVSTEQRERDIQDRVAGETEALSTELSLTVHPDRFPEPVRDQVGEVSREFRIYIETLRYAAAYPQERSELLARAGSHLTKGESALTELERLTGSNSRIGN